MNPGNTAIRGRFIPNPKLRLQEQLREVMRLRLALRTEQT
jgi:hypothetical protein